MIKQIYIQQGKRAWLLPISAWIGVCKDGARNAGYAFPDDCEIPSDLTPPEDMLWICIDHWHPIDFEDFLRAYERGDIKAPKKQELMDREPTKEEFEAVIAEAEKPEPLAPAPKPKKVTRKKK